MWSKLGSSCAAPLMLWARPCGHSSPCFMLPVPCQQTPSQTQRGYQRLQLQFSAASLPCFGAWKDHLAQEKVSLHLQWDWPGPLKGEEKHFSCNSEGNHFRKRSPPASILVGSLWVLGDYALMYGNGISMQVSALPCIHDALAYRTHSFSARFLAHSASCSVFLSLLWFLILVACPHSSAKPI